LSSKTDIVIRRVNRLTKIRLKNRMILRKE
jgi:hypothetical protein